MEDLESPAYEIIAQPYKGSIEECLLSLESGKSGLTQEEAQKRLARFGANKLEEAPPDPLWKKILAQFNDVMVIILILAAIVSGFWRWIEAVIIIAIVIVNAILGRAGRTLEQAVAACEDVGPSYKSFARRERNSSILSLSCGDIIIFEAGTSCRRTCASLKPAILKPRKRR